MNQIIDFTIDGKCSQCGACCGDILPLTPNEVRQIKKYVRSHGIREQRHNAMVGADMTCPFRDEANRKCLVYEVRPWICRQFMCNHTYEDIMKAKFDSMKDADVVFMRHTFFESNEDVNYFDELRKSIVADRTDAK